MLEDVGHGDSEMIGAKNVNEHIHAAFGVGDGFEEGGEELLSVNKKFDPAL